MLYNNANGAITGYEVIIDYEKLKKIREEIEANCSVIIKCKTRGNQYFDNQFYGNNIRNMQRGQLVESIFGEYDSYAANI